MVVPFLWSYKQQKAYAFIPYALKIILMKIHFCIWAILAIAFNNHQAFAQRLVINEVMSANISTIADEDGDYSDWIELFNADTVRIDLTNFGLSDDPARPFRWKFPKIAIEPNQFILLFASGKDIRTIPIHWETIIDWGDEWKYLVPTAEPAANWRALEFDDSAWLTGPSGFGYDDGDDATNVGSPDPFQPSPIAVFIRKKIIIENINDVTGAMLHVDYDDGFVAYWNGEEIARANIGFVGVPPAYNQFANRPAEARMYRGGEPEKFIIENISSVLRPGENLIAMEVHNSELYSSDLTLIPFLTLQMTAIPPHARGPSRHLKFPPSPKLHTNFKLKAAGETLSLCNAAGELIDQVVCPYLPPNVSFGRQPDGATSWRLFEQATPEGSNATPGFQAMLDPPQFSHPAGLYSQPLFLELSSNLAGSVVHYTLDGSSPTEDSPQYQQPILINRTTVVRAKAFSNQWLPSRTITQTYILDQSFTIPVISIATNPKNLWDRETGIYVFGNNADTVNYPYWGSNFWEDWERPIHIEMFEPNGDLGFSIDAGVKIFGSWSRLYPQKSLSIFARNQYGDEEINYQIFPDKPISKFQSIVLRNSGQDWGRTFFRDAMMHYLVKPLDLDIQAYRPAVVFLNGEFWGIHNIREKMSEHYLASNRGVDPENIDFIERDTMVIKGSTDHYRRLLDYVAQHDMRLPSNYEFVKTQMDVENFNDYMLSVMFYANSDWPWNNVKCWRPRTAQGKWRWLLYDLDYGFHGGHLGPNANLFREIRNQKNGTTLLFFKLLENEEHRRLFANQFADRLNSVFEPSRVIEVINRFKAGIEPEMPKHIARWKGSFVGPWWLGKSIDSMEEWYSHIQVLIDFAQRRPDYVRQHIMDEFRLWDGLATIQLNVSPSKAGRIRINRLLPRDYPWSGVYFVNLPITLTAIPAIGYRFKEWIGVSPNDSISISASVQNGQVITAVFKKADNASAPVVINEINYQSSPDFNTEDWVELHNFGDAPIDLSDWVLLDGNDNHRFVIPANCVITGNGYFVLCRNESAFGSLFPNIKNRTGNLEFGLSSEGELLRLYDGNGQLIDSVRYGVRSPWPEAPRGQGYTLELLDPRIDNGLAQSWSASTRIGGTPGTANSAVETSIANPAQQIFSFALDQNYPNPFNSHTSIRFSLAQEGRVILKIFNIRGEEIQTLVDEKLSLGIHETVWNGTNRHGQKVSSGIYFCCLLAGRERLVRKMLLLQ